MLRNEDHKSRQVKRAEFRADAFKEMSRDYGGAPRKVRRRMARGLAKREYRRSLFFGEGLEAI